MTVRKMVVGLLVVLVGVVVGCSSRESRITGQWVEEGKNGTGDSIEFFSDKTVALPTSDLTMSGTLAVLSDGRIKADVSAIGIHYVILGELKGSTLLLDLDGRKGRFVKGKPIAEGGCQLPIPIGAHLNPQQSCMNNLRIIDAGKEQWAMVSRKTNGQPVVISGVNEYIKGNTTPVCPEGGTYSYNVIGSNPNCSIHGEYVP